MDVIQFSRRELRQAWRSAEKASQSAPRTNSHRLLLFYAVECGLKAAFLQERGREFIDEEIAEEFRLFSHDLNKVMAKLKIGSSYLLPRQIYLTPMKHGDGKSIPRSCGCGDINQVWRYGGEIEQPGDVEIETKLQNIHALLAERIR